VRAMFFYLGEVVRNMVAYLGELGLLIWETLRQGLVPPWEAGLVIAEMDASGVKSLFITALSALFIGMVMTLQTGFAMARFGAKAYIGPAVALSVLRELGPVVTALLVGGRVGSGITAELGAMKVTEQIDAMRAIGSNYVKKLIVPKVAAVTLTLPLLTVLADGVGIFGGMLIAMLQFDIEPLLFFNAIIYRITFADILSGIGKTFVFGFLIGIIGCHHGLSVSRGTEEIGRFTTATVVSASISVLIADFFLTKLLFMFEL
jgi:phospholipid/cholesterol/gamma-HCH transport system permease protein